MAEEGKSMSKQVAALLLFEHQFSAQTIMDVVQLTEEQLENVIPRELWLDDKIVRCRRCGGMCASRTVRAALDVK